MQIWKSCDYKLRHNDLITKTIENKGKMWTSAVPNKIYIVGMVLMRGYSKSNFYWIWATVSKIMGIYVNFTKPLTKYAHVKWPWLHISKTFIHLSFD